MASQEKKPEAIEAARKLQNVPWCEQYERMISGMLYDPFVPELVNGRLRGKRATHKYNSYFPDEITEPQLVAARYEMLKSLLGNVGKDAYIEAPFHVDYGCNISIGDNFYANMNMVILDCAIVTIGSRVMFGPFVSILSATHETSVQSRRDAVEYADSVTIGDDCWIGGHVTILPGVVIGKGCTIGASSVVTKSIPDFSVAVGTPARVIKKVEPVPDL